MGPNAALSDSMKSDTVMELFKWVYLQSLLLVFKCNMDHQQKFTAMILLNKTPTALDSANKTLLFN